MFQRFAVIGNPIEHSLSPVIHQYFAKQEHVQLIYEKIKTEDHSFEQQVAHFFLHEGKGLNVTLPFKQRAFSLAQQHSPRCNQAGAANTLWMKGNQLHADNTDGVGFIRDLHRHVSLVGARVLILGAGGATRGIISPILENNPTDLCVANRTLSRAQEFQRAFPQVRCVLLQDVAGPFDLVINATSASSSEAFGALPTECMSLKPFCYDLSYAQHGPTAYVHYAKNLGCEAVDGLGMLVEQAAEAFCIWHGVMPETKDLMTLLRR